MAIEVKQLDEQIEKARKERDKMLAEQNAIQSVYSWEAPERVFEPKERNWYVSVAAIAMLVIVYGALTNNIGLIFVVITFIMVTYALNTIPPKNVKHEVMNKGLYVFNFLYTWRNIQYFWITKRGNSLLINLEVKERDIDKEFHRIIILSGKADLKKVVSFLVQYIDYLGPREASSGLLTNITEGEYIPLVNFVHDPTTPTKDPADSLELQKIRPAE